MHFNDFGWNHGILLHVTGPTFESGYETRDTYGIVYARKIIPWVTIQTHDFVTSFTSTYVPQFLKEVSSEMAPELTLIFQASLDQGIVPVVLRQAIVVPVFKKYRCTDRNYRPISLTCICTKILEHIVYSSISKL